MITALRTADFGTVLKIWRKYTGASQAKTAALTGLAQSDVSPIETHRRLVTSAAVQHRILAGLEAPDHLHGIVGTDNPQHIPGLNFGPALQPRQTTPTAPTQPREFWQHPTMRAALQSRHIGRIIHAYRTHPWHQRDISQQHAASWLGMNQATLSRTESGRPPGEISKLIQWANALKVPQDLLWFTLPTALPAETVTPRTNQQLCRLRLARQWTQAETAQRLRDHIHANTGRRPPIDAHTIERLENGEVTHLPDAYRTALRAVYGVNTDAELGLSGTRQRGTPHSGTTAPTIRSSYIRQPQELEYSIKGPFRLLPVGGAALHHSSVDAAAMQAFRSADLQVGGGHLYASVLQYLQRDVAPRLFGVEGGPENSAVFTAAAALTEMAGWMAHDAGRDTTARQHFSRSLALAQIGEDHQLGAHVLGSMSHLASHQNQPHEAIALARQGRTVLHAAPPHPGLEAQLLAMEARGHAGLRESDTSVELLIQAEKVLDKVPTGPPSPWVSKFDAGSLASEAARCMRQLGDWEEAARQAERVVLLRPSTRARSRAFGQLTLVSVLMAQGRPDEACVLAQEVLDSTQALGSFLVIQQLLELGDLLQPHRANKIVSEFLTYLDDALRDRLWLYEQLAHSERGQVPRRRED
jgi:transcriptional regulator with XRE-family HTH domain